jgi:NodT family efflux transporter outer membrane factor (OMF) lipoprotein
MIVSTSNFSFPGKHAPLLRTVSKKIFPIMNLFNRRLIVLCSALALSACTTLGPDYQEPQVEWLNKWQPDFYGQLDLDRADSEQDLRFWWKLLEDPVLDRLIGIAREKNIDLRIAGLRILESRALLGIAGSSLYPQVQQLGASLSAVESQTRGGDLPSDDQSFISYQGGFNLGWELDFWGRFQRGIESADANFFNSIANQQNVQILLSSQIAQLYYVYRVTEQRIVIARENARLQKRSFEITEQTYASGQESELDLQQAKSQYLGTLATIPSLQIALIQTRNALAALLARPPGPIPELTPGNKVLPTISLVLLKDIPASLLMRRPDIRAAAWQVAAQSAQIGIAEADFYPSVSLLGSIDWSGASEDSIPDSGVLSVGPGVTWNLFDHGKIANNVRLQDARLQQLIEQYQNSVLSAAREIDDAAIGVVQSLEQSRILTQAVVATERALTLANKRYREGYSDFQRVLDAQRALFVQTEREVINQGNHISSAINLYKALGGGWLDTTIEQAVPIELRDTMAARSDWGDLLDAALPLNSDEPPPNTSAVQNER